MSKYHSPKDYLDAARSPNTSPAELRELARTSYNFVLTAVASNPNTEADVLASLVPEEIQLWNEQDLAVAIVQHPNTPVDALNMLAERLVSVLDNGRGHQQGFKAGVLLCSNPLTPIEAIGFILRHESVAMQFRKVVARETCREDVLAILAGDRSEIVKTRALKSIQVLSAKSAE